MRRASPALHALLAVCLLAVLAPARPCLAQADPDMAGWERDSAYNALFDKDNADIVRGTLLRVVEIVPIPGMAKGYGLELKAQGGKKIFVHLGPAPYVSYLAHALTAGDQIKALGSWAKLADDMVFMAGKIRRNESLEVKLRSSRDGRPYWTMPDTKVRQEKLED